MNSHGPGRDTRASYTPQLGPNIMKPHLSKHNLAKSAQPPETLVGKTADLLRSLHDSILSLRNEAEVLRAELRAEDTINPETAGVKPQINKLETLIRDCQKVEKTLVDQSALILTNTPAYDFESVRAEIHSRLARLRATQPRSALPE